MLAKLEGIEGEDLTLLLTAVLFHDSGFLRQQKEHERISCEIATEYLPAYGYSPEQVKRICGMIMATKIPQTPHNKLEELICDADLDYLGRDDFFKIGNGLFEELCMYGIISSEDEWNQLQIRFLEKHTYFTESAKKLRKPKKDEYIKMVKAKLKKD
jgi:predicted metal-dependent HD superfamily phosphohydrolase